jgi:hypothetical protein
VIDRRAIKVAIHVLHRGGSIGVYVGCEDDVPESVKLVEFGSPQVVTVGHVDRWLESKLDVGVVPVPASESAFVIE